MSWLLVLLADLAWAGPSPAECRHDRDRALDLLGAGDPSAWQVALETGEACAGALPLGGRVDRWTKQGWAAYDRWDGEAADAAASKATLWALATDGPGSDAVAGTAALLAHAAGLAWTPNPARREAVKATLEGRDEGWLARGVLAAVEDDAAEAIGAFERTLDVATGADWALAANTLGFERGDATLLAAAASAIEAARGPWHPALGQTLNNLAIVHKNRGAFDEALPIHLRALAIRERALGPDHIETAISLNNLGYLHRARGDYGAALPFFLRAVDIKERTLGPEHPETATSLNNLGSLHRASGAYDEALPLYRRALEIRERAVGPDHPVTAQSLNHLALLYQERGDLEDALPCLLRALDIRERTLGPDHPDTAASLGDLASLHLARGAYDDALPLYRRSLDITERVYGPDHPSTATSLGNLAGLHLARGEYDEALQLYRRALDIRERALGPDHLHTAINLNNLAALQAERGDYDEALSLYRRALDIQERVLGPDHPDTATGLNNLAALHHARGELDDALHLQRRALDIRERALGPDHPGTAISLDNLGYLYEARGDYDEALPLFVRALDIRERTLGPDHPNTATSLNNLALLHEARGADDDALPLHRRALDIRERALGPDHPDTANSLNNLAGLHYARGAYDDALLLYRRALDVRERVLGPDHPNTAQSLNNLACLHRDRRAHDEALPLFVRALAIQERALQPDHPDTARSLHNLARLHRDMGHPDLARPLVDRALPIALDTPDVTTRLSVLSGAADQSAAESDLPAAALWGKLAVRDIEALRANVASLGDDTGDAGFVDQYEVIYRALADRLVTLGRLPEAEQVLALLKAEEQHQFLRRDSDAVGGEPVALTEAEQSWLTRFDAIRDTVVADAKEFDTLRKVAARGTLPPDRQARLDELTARREAASQAVAQALTDLRAALAGADRDESWGRLSLERTDRVQRQLKSLGAGTVLVHAIVLDDHLLLLLTTPEAQVAETVPVAAEDLHRAVAAFRQALTDPSADPRPAGKQLYDWLLRPLEGHLGQAGAKSLLTYLDGTLRYVPIAALHDGERFVVEKWATSVYTPAAESDLARTPVDDPFVAAFGASQGAKVEEMSFSALPSIPGELDAVVRADDTDSGAVAGRSFLDAAFTSQALSDALHLGTPWVHVASHFHFAPGGTEADSFLLLGDGKTLSVADLRLGDFPLADVDLLALSACQTAMGERRADGSEVEGLAVVAQNQGAAAVLATLWPVADASTAAWMAALYQGQVEDPVSRAAAVQRVQSAFLTGELAADHLPTAARGLVATAPTTAATPGLEGWRHPYFWAPFVLYGAGR